MARNRIETNLQHARPARCCFCLGSKPSSRARVPKAAALVCCAHDLPALCPLPLQPLTAPVLIIKRDLANDKSSCHLSVKHWPNKLKKKKKCAQHLLASLGVSLIQPFPLSLCVNEEMDAQED